MATNVYATIVNTDNGYTRVITENKWCSHLVCGEETDGKSTDDTADGVHTEGIESVIESKIVLHLCAEVAERTAEEADEKGAGHVNEASGRGDAHET